MKNDFGPDSGLFLRSTEKGQAYQYMVDYHAAGNLAGIYGEGLSGGIRLRNFDFLDKVTEIKQHDCPVSAADQAGRLAQAVATWEVERAAGTDRRQSAEDHDLDQWRPLYGIRPTSEKRHPDTGGIALQVHGGGDFTKQFVRYRGMRVKVLD